MRDPGIIPTGEGLGFGGSGWSGCDVCFFGWVWRSRDWRDEEEEGVYLMGRVLARFPKLSKYEILIPSQRISLSLSLSLS